MSCWTPLPQCTAQVWGREREGRAVTWKGDSKQKEEAFWRANTVGTNAGTFVVGVMLCTWRDTDSIPGGAQAVEAGPPLPPPGALSSAAA